MKHHWEENERKYVINEKANNNRILGALAMQEKVERAYINGPMQLSQQLLE